MNLYRLTYAFDADTIYTTEIKAKNAQKAIKQSIEYIETTHNKPFNTLVGFSILDLSVIHTEPNPETVFEAEELIE